MELTLTLTEHTMKDSGLTTNSTVRELSHGPMVPDMRDSTKMERKRAKEDLLSLMEVITRDSSVKMRSVGWATTTGLMANHTLVTGVRTRWTAMENYLGKMASNTLETLSMIREKDRVPLSGLMVVNILESGERVSSMALAHTLAKRASRNRDNGQMEGRSSGSRRLTEKTMVLMDSSNRREKILYSLVLNETFIQYEPICNGY